ncbi:MAG: hypothetical protein NTY19_09630 [Planctomycetota bacterium]|nr:hypothetical protein [Planctomycetota bacterium]
MTVHIVHWLTACVFLAVTAPANGADAPAPPVTNLALVATASTSFVSGHETIRALNDGWKSTGSTTSAACGCRRPAG